jgi:hypothetical protein
MRRGQGEPTGEHVRIAPAAGLGDTGEGHPRGAEKFSISSAWRQAASNFASSKPNVGLADDVAETVVLSSDEGREIS